MLKLFEHKPQHAPNSHLKNSAGAPSVVTGAAEALTDTMGAQEAARLVRTERVRLDAAQKLDSFELPGALIDSYVPVQKQRAECRRQITEKENALQEISRFSLGLDRDAFVKHFQSSEEFQTARAGYRQQRNAFLDSATGQEFIELVRNLLKAEEEAKPMDFTRLYCDGPPDEAVLNRTLQTLETRLSRASGPRLTGEKPA